MSRHPVGIATIHDESTATGALVVICDDGSIWLSSHLGGEWREGRAVPGTARHTLTDAGVATQRAEEVVRARETAEREMAELKTRQR